MESLMVISSTAVFYGLLTSTLLFLCYSVYSYFKRRVNSIDHFINTIVEFVEIYYEKNPHIPNTYFNEMIYPRWEMIVSFWVNNFEEFIVEENKFEELVKFSKEYVAEKKTPVFEFEPDFEIEREYVLTCPWCSSETADNFSWLEMEDAEGVGTIQCKTCGATTPIGSYDECITMLEVERQDEEV